MSRASPFQNDLSPVRCHASQFVTFWFCKVRSCQPLAQFPIRNSTYSFGRPRLLFRHDPSYPPYLSGFGGLEGSLLAFGTQFRGFKPSRSRPIFHGEKKSSAHPFFGREVKPSVPCRIFAACKRTRKCMRGSRAFPGKIHRPFLAQVIPPFTTRGLWWRHLAVQVGKTKDQVLYNTP